MSAKRRKYKFNWLDHLYFMGKGSWRVPLRAWPTPFEALGWAVVGVPLMFLILFVAKSLLTGYICIACLIAASFGWEWLVRKYRFTPQREKAYFRRYPDRKQYSIKRLFWIPVAMLLTAFAIWGFVFLRIFGWIDKV